MSAIHSEASLVATRNTTSQHRGTRFARRVPFTLLLATLMRCSFDDAGHLQDGDAGGNSLLDGRAGLGGAAAGGAGGGTSGGAADGLGGRSGGSSAPAGAGGDAPSSAGANSGGSGGTTSDPGAILGPWEYNSLADAMQWPPSGLDVPPDASVSWTAAGEEAPLGSMVLSTSTTVPFQLTVPPAQANQAHRKVFVRARAATEGGTESIKPFVMSTGWKWSDGGEFELTSEWSTAMMDLDNPSYEGVDYDASSLIHIGVVLSCGSTQAEPVTCGVWIDRAWIE